MPADTAEPATIDAASSAPAVIVAATRPLPPILAAISVLIGIERVAYLAMAGFGLYLLFGMSQGKGRRRR
jgi:hypothetical protein